MAWSGNGGFRSQRGSVTRQRLTIVIKKEKHKCMKGFINDL